MKLLPPARLAPLNAIYVYFLATPRPLGSREMATLLENPAALGELARLCADALGATLEEAPCNSR